MPNPRKYRTKPDIDTLDRESKPSDIYRKAVEEGSEVQSYEITHGKQKLEVFDPSLWPPLRR